MLKSNDPKHIADKIIELLDKPELPEKVSKNAYNYVRENSATKNLGIMAKNNNGDQSPKMKILFVNPFAGTSWARIGFFADQWSRNGRMVEVLGAFSYKAFSKRGVKRLNNINIFNLTFNMGLTQPLVFILNALISFAVSHLRFLDKA